MQVSGPVLSITKPLNASFPLNFKPAEADLVADGMQGVRAAVRELGQPFVWRQRPAVVA
jgi:hypothetical protein